MIKANIILDQKIWKKKLKRPNNYFKKRLNKLSKFRNFKNKGQEFTVLLTNNKKMKELNMKFRNKNKSTDVLSFPLKLNFKKKRYIGDIAISFEITNRRSKLSSFSEEFDRLWIHGFLHLLGYDHKKIKEYQVMKKQEELILKELNRLN